MLPCEVKMFTVTCSEVWIHSNDVVCERSAFCKIYYKNSRKRNESLTGCKEILGVVVSCWCVLHFILQFSEALRVWTSSSERGLPGLPVSSGRGQDSAMRGKEKQTPHTHIHPPPPPPQQYPDTDPLFLTNYLP